MLGQVKASVGRRLAVVVVLAGSLLVLPSGAPAASRARATDPAAGTFTVVHAYVGADPAASAPLTICNQGQPVSSSLAFGQTIGPMSAPLLFAAFVGAGRSCSDAPDYSVIGAVVPGKRTTIVLVRTASGMGATGWSTDTTCIDPSEGQVLLANGTGAFLSATATTDPAGPGSFPTYLAGGVRPGQSSTPARLAAGAYTVDAGPVAGTRRVSLAGGTSTALIALGAANGPDRSWLELTEAIPTCAKPGASYLTLVHGVTSAYPADDVPLTICNNGVALADDFHLGQQVGPVVVEGLSLVILKGAGRTCRITDPPTLVGAVVPNTSYVYAVFGDGSGDPRSFPLADASGPLDCVAPGRSRLTVAHAATPTGPLALWQAPAGGTPSFIGLEDQGSAADPLDLPAGDYDLWLYPQDQKGGSPVGPLVGPGRVRLAEGSATAAFGIGGPGAGTFLTVASPPLPTCDGEVGGFETTTTSTTSIPASVPVSAPPAVPATGVAGTPAYAG